jgi:hypothetical protein
MACTFSLLMWTHFIFFLKVGCLMSSVLFQVTLGNFLPSGLLLSCLLFSFFIRLLLLLFCLDNFGILTISNSQGILYLNPRMFISFCSACSDMVAVTLDGGLRLWSHECCDEWLNLPKLIARLFFIILLSQH